MGNFKSGGGKRFGGSNRGGFGGRSSGRPSFSGKSWGGGSGDKRRGPITMHQAICDQCGKSCEVPFLPTAGKPVYCNACFETQRGTDNNRGGDRFPQKDFNSYQSPVRTDFGNSTNKGNNDELRKQLELLNAKMDRLIKAVETIANTKPSVTEEKTKTPTKTVPVTKVKKSTKSVSKK